MQNIFNLLKKKNKEGNFMKKKKKKANTYMQVS